MSDFQLGEGYAIMQCPTCGLIMGIYANAEKEQKQLEDVWCVECHNKSVRNPE